MIKLTKKVSIGGQTRHQVTLIGEPCAEGSQLARLEQFRILQTIIDMPSLTSCELSPYQTMRQYHNGHAWVLELEALVPDPDP